MIEVAFPYLIGGPCDGHEVARYIGPAGLRSHLSAAHSDAPDGHLDTTGVEIADYELRSLITGPAPVDAPITPRPDRPEIGFYIWAGIADARLEREHAAFNALTAHLELVRNPD